MHEEVKYKCDLEQKTFEYMYDQQKSIKKTLYYLTLEINVYVRPCVCEPRPPHLCCPRSRD